MQNVFETIQELYQETKELLEAAERDRSLRDSDGGRVVSGDEISAELVKRLGFHDAVTIDRNVQIGYGIRKDAQYPWQLELVPAVTIHSSAPKGAFSIAFIADVDTPVYTVLHGDGRPETAQTVVAALSLDPLT
jgi:hypothetical protein